MIKVSAYSVFPAEVEAIMSRHPAVAEVGVVGVPDPYRGEDVLAFVVLQPGAAATEEALVECTRPVSCDSADHVTGPERRITRFPGRWDAVPAQRSGLPTETPESFAARLLSANIPLGTWRSDVVRSPPS